MKEVKLGANSYTLLGILVGEIESNRFQRVKMLSFGVGQRRKCWKTEDNCTFSNAENRFFVFFSKTDSTRLQDSQDEIL